MKYFDEEDAITEYEKQLQKKDNEIERLKEEYVMLQNASDEVEEELQQRIDKAIEYIENEMPWLWEVDNAWDDINGNYQHNYKEYETIILLNKIK